MPTPRRKPSPPKAFVVMSNDYPDCVFDTENEAEQYCQERNNAPENSHGSGFGRRIYYRTYEFNINARGRNPFK